MDAYYLVKYWVHDFQEKKAPTQKLVEYTMPTNMVQILLGFLMIERSNTYESMPNIKQWNTYFNHLDTLIILHAKFE